MQLGLCVCCCAPARPSPKVRNSLSGRARGAAVDPMSFSDDEVAEDIDIVEDSLSVADGDYFSVLLRSTSCRVSFASDTDFCGHSVCHRDSVCTALLAFGFAVSYCFSILTYLFHCTVLYCTTLYCTVVYCTVLCCTVVYYAGLSGPVAKISSCVHSCSVAYRSVRVAFVIPLAFICVAIITHPMPMF